MKLSIKYINDSKVIEKYSIERQINKQYKVKVYYRYDKPVVSKDIPLENISQFSNLLDVTMYRQMQTAIENEDILYDASRETIASQVKLFNIISKTIITLSSLTLSIAFLNVLNLSLIPILFKITNKYCGKLVNDFVDDEDAIVDKYALFIDYIEKRNNGNIEDMGLTVNNIDKVKKKKLNLVREKLNSIEEGE